MFNEDFHSFREAELQIEHETKGFFGRKPVKLKQLDLFEPEEICGEVILIKETPKKEGWGRK